MQLLSDYLGVLLPERGSGGVGGLGPLQYLLGLLAAAGNGGDLLVDVRVGVRFLLVVLLVFHLGCIPVGSGHLGHVLELALVVVVGGDPVGSDSPVDEGVHGLHLPDVLGCGCCSAHQVGRVAFGVGQDDALGVLGAREGGLVFVEDAGEFSDLLPDSPELVPDPPGVVHCLDGAASGLSLPPLGFHSGAILLVQGLLRVPV